MKVELNGVRVLMVRRKISQREVAERLEVHHNSVNNWLAGRADPGLSGLIDLMDAIGISAEELMDMRFGDLMELKKDKTPV